MSDPRAPTVENAEGRQACPSAGSAGKVLICVRPTCSELGEKMGSGLDDPYEDFRRKVAEIVSAGRGALIADQHRELVCAFESAAAAFKCTQSIQRAVAESERRQWLGARIGCFGTYADDRSDAWQYAVQCSQNLANRATPGQTIACTSTLAGLDEVLLGETLPLDASDWACDRTGVGLPLCLIRWQEEVPTRIANPVRRDNIITRAQQLRLRWRGEKLVLDKDSAALTIGRSSEADITIESEYASRIHAGLRHVNAAFILTDCSTNGTYVKIDDDAEVYLHDDELILRGEGCISLGRRTAAARGKLVFFKTEQAGPSTTRSRP
ncbi:MAG: FHA domain-containing protein [Sedimenticolaceae bacterium]